MEVANWNNIATPGNSHPSRHNDWHDCLLDFTGSGPELCPRLQAGESHNVSVCSVPVNDSYFSSLQAAPPTTTNFSKTQYTYKMQLGFNVADNASVKAYVLIQVKKTNESTWHVLKAQCGSTWKFKEVNLTDWNGSLQSDNFYIPWNGDYEGGAYSPGSHNFDIKITVIDQGANYSEDSYIFTGNVIPANAIVSPTTNNVGSVKVDTPISNSFVISNTGGEYLNLEIRTTNYGFDLDPSTPNTWEYLLTKTLCPGSSTTISYAGTMLGSVGYGPFTETITIDATNYSINKTHNIVGTLLLPDYCYGETKAMSSSPEE